MKFKSILHFARVPKEVEKDLKASQKIQTDKPTYMPLHRISYGTNEFLCCISGGFMTNVGSQGNFFKVADNPETYISSIGLCALYTLQSVKMEKEFIIFSEIANGPTPIHEKIIRAFDEALKRDCQKICFLVEIDGKAHKELLLSLDIKDCIYE